MLGVISSYSMNFLCALSWNQGGYDAVEITKLTDNGIVLRIVQVTRGKRHSYKLEYVCTLMEKLRDETKNIEFKYLDVVMLYPSNREEPNINDITGDRQLATVCTDFKSKESWNKNCIHKLTFDCSYN